MSEQISTCPICKHDQNVSGTLNGNDDTVSYDCPVCGKYIVPFMWSSLRNEAVADPKLSAWIREQNEQGLEVRFTSESTIRRVLAGLPDYRPSEKQLKLLQAIERRSAHAGNEIPLDDQKDYPLAHARNPEELRFHLSALLDRRLVEFQRSIFYVLTPTGWNYLDEHTSDLEEKTQGFVAMSFSDGMKPIWDDAIKPAIAEAGYTPYRVDEDVHSENIILRIMAEIKDSRFVVADLTEQRNGVYFEAGYGLGLGLPVMWTIRKDGVENVHFDTAQYNQIRWESAEELKEALSDYISAIIGKRNRTQR